MALHRTAIPLRSIAVAELGRFEERPAMPDSPPNESSEPRFDAFLSYNSADRPVVRRIQRFLENYRPPNRSRRLKVYLDETDMRGGSLPENLSKALAESRALVVCWSDKAAGSPWVKTEIADFRNLGQESRIAVVHVGGAGPTVEHEAFTGLKPVEHDLRRGWRAGVLTPAGRLELLRLIAFLTDVDMRVLRNWARRRAFRNALVALAVATLPLGGVMSLRLPQWNPVSLSHYDQPIEPIACEVVDGKLWVASWSEAAGEVSGAREYFVTYPDVLTNPAKQIARPTSFALPKRALPRTMVSRDLWNRVKTVLEKGGATDWLARHPRWEDAARVAEPRPSHFVFILPIARGKPDDQELRWAAMDRLPIPETDGTLVVVHENGSSPTVSTVSDLSPPLWRDRTADNQRRTSPARGMSVVWQQNGEIWIGVPGERGIAGGLWHSPNAGESWQRVDGFFSVTSIDLRGAQNGEETVMVAEENFKRVSGTEFVEGSSRVVERAPDDKWTRSDAPPYGTDSQVEICGTLPNGTLHMRVDKQIYRQSSRPLYRLVVDVIGSSKP